MNPDPLLTTALHHWGARAVPFSDAAETTPWASPAWAAAISACRGPRAAVRGPREFMADDADRRDRRVVEVERGKVRLAVGRGKVPAMRRRQLGAASPGPRLRLQAC